jgi:hypothetical protein
MAGLQAFNPCPHARTIRLPAILARPSPLFVRFTGEYPQEFRWHTNQLTLTRETHIEHLRTTAEDLALLVQPREQRLAVWPLGDLLHPAEQHNPVTVNIAPPVPGRLGHVSGHGAPPFLVAVVVGRLVAGSRAAGAAHSTGAQPGILDSGSRDRARSTITSHRGGKPVCPHFCLAG